MDDSRLHGRSSLDHGMFPHIFSLIVANLDYGGLVAMRSASRAMQRHVDAQLSAHIRIERIRVPPYTFMEQRRCTRILHASGKRIPALLNWHESARDAFDESYNPRITPPMVKGHLQELTQHVEVIDCFHAGTLGRLAEFCPRLRCLRAFDDGEIVLYAKRTRAHINGVLAAGHEGDGPREESVPSSPADEYVPPSTPSDLTYPVVLFGRLAEFKRGICHWWRVYLANCCAVHKEQPIVIRMPFDAANHRMPTIDIQFPTTQCHRGDLTVVFDRINGPLRDPSFYQYPKLRPFGILFRWFRSLIWHSRFTTRTTIVGVLDLPPRYFGFQEDESFAHETFRQKMLSCIDTMERLYGPPIRPWKDNVRRKFRSHDTLRFLTVEEYKAEVGEEAFKLQTQEGWSK